AFRAGRPTFLGRRRGRRGGLDAVIVLVSGDPLHERLELGGEVLAAIGQEDLELGAVGRHEVVPSSCQKPDGGMPRCSRIRSMSSAGSVAGRSTLGGRGIRGALGSGTSTRRRPSASTITRRGGSSAATRSDASWCARMA